MKTLKISLCLLLTAVFPRFASADLVGPYTADANTLFLLHFDEAAGGTFTTNYGSKGGKFYSVNEATASATPPTVTTMLGAAGYVNGPTNFNNCMTNPTTGYEFGYDANNSGAYQGDASGSSLSADAIAMTNLNIGFGGQTPFTIEALIRPTTTAGNQEIVCTDSSASSRAFQFRITSATLQFQFINGSQAISGTIPTTGNDAFVAGNWYHVAITYNGTTATLYWTLLNPTNGAAHVLSSASLALGTTQGATTGPLIIGNENRNTAGEQFMGSIDEVRISSVARGSGQMQFYSPLVTVTANPVSQNVDYNQPVTFSIGASSQFALGYQWRFNSNSIAGATNTSYVITNVAAGNAGYYDCIVTNTIGYAATSSPALLVVGAANFLANRYSFSTSATDPNSGLLTTPDSVGGATGTNFGNATVTGGQLVLDGSAGTYMQLPPNLYNGGNATALTFEFWATFGSNPNNVYVFAFGVTNYVVGQGIVGFNHAMYSPHNGGGGQTASATPGDPQFAQTATATGVLDGQTVHVAVVFDPPNKLLSIYTNGVLEAVNTNFTVNISSLNDQFSYIGQSLWAADPYLNASIDELRIFKGALSSISIKQSQDQGPNTLLADGPAKFILQPVSTAVPLGQSASFTAATVGYLPITYQWFKNGTPIAGATNASYAYIPTLADNNATFQVNATNTIGVTTYVTNSSAATLTVFVPPTLVWIDSADGGSGDGLWNTASLNWTNPGVAGPIAFTQTNGVLFDNRGSGSPNVDLAQAITPYNVAVNAASDYLLFSSSGNGLLNGQGGITKLNSDTLIIDVTNNLSGPVTVSGGKLQIGNGDNFGSLGSGPVTNNATLSLNRSDTALNVGNAIHGTGTLSVDGGGAVTISGNNDFSGSTLLNAGIVFLTSGTGLGSTSSGTTVASGAQLYITANVDVAEGLSLAGAGDGNGALRKGGAGATTENGAIALALDSTIGVDSGATLTLSNAVSGTAALTAVGGGTLTLSANSSFNGGFTLNGPTVNVNANRALGPGTVTVSGAGHFVIGDGLNLTNFVQTSTVSPGTGFGLLMVNDNTNGTVTTVSGPLEFDASPANGGDFVGPTTSGYLNVTGPVTNNTTGTVSSRNGFVRLSGGGSYSLFDLNQGTLSLGANNGISTNAAISMALSAAATFDLNGFNQSLTGLTDGATSSELVTNSAASPSTLTLNLSSGGTYSGVIAGNIALVVNGSAGLDLAGTNAYTGNTTVNGGTLELAQPSLAAGSTVTVASGAFLQLDFTATNIVSGLVLNGVSQPLGIYNSTTSPSYLTGPGSLQVAVTVATNPTNIVATLSGTTLNLSWPADHTGWRLLQQTNHLAQGISANTNDWGTVSGSASTNKVSLTIDPAKPTEFYRMVYP
jgi:autotransporter-associated beta strand protein